MKDFTFEFFSFEVWWALIYIKCCIDLKTQNKCSNTEYLGELYLQTDDLAKAKERLKKLDDICTFGCEEFNDLKAAITAYENN